MKYKTLFFIDKVVFFVILLAYDIEKVDRNKVIKIK